VYKPWVPFHYFNKYEVYWVLYILCGLL
jgi:hypothetical protein